MRGWQRKGSRRLIFPLGDGDDPLRGDKKELISDDEPGRIVLPGTDPGGKGEEGLRLRGVRHGWRIDEAGVNASSQRLDGGPHGGREFLPQGVQVTAFDSQDLYLVRHAKTESLRELKCNADGNLMGVDQAWAA